MRGMGGSARKPDKPRPSYEDGDLRDPEIEEMQLRVENAGEDQRVSLLGLISRAVRHAPTDGR